MGDSSGRIHHARQATSETQSPTLPSPPTGPNGSTSLNSAGTSSSASTQNSSATIGVTAGKTPQPEEGATSTTSPTSTNSGLIPSSHTFTELPGATNSDIGGPGEDGSKGLSSGEVAGVAIGCLIAGALIAAAAVFFIMRRKSAKRHHPGGNYGHQSQYNPQGPLNGYEKSAAAATGRVFDENSVAAIVENNLPQPIEDQALLNEMAKLQNSIKNHVSSYYHTSPGPADANQEAIETLGGNLPLPGSSLKSLLSNPGTRIAALRFCVAWAVLHRVSPHSHPSESFLPPEVAGSFQSMTGMGHNPQAREAFMSRWRQITSELMKPTYARNQIAPNDARMHNIVKTLGLLDEIVQPYADSRHSNDHRRRNLEEILKRAAGFAFMLFSQPSSWRFDWDGPHAAETGSLVIFPALVQTVDENGRALNPPHVFGQVELAPAAEWRA